MTPKESIKKYNLIILTLHVSLPSVDPLHVYNKEINIFIAHFALYL